MSRVRNPEYDHRDQLFAEMCASCARARRCTFRTSPEGPEEVCVELVELGNNDCEYCMRKKTNGNTCMFRCCFFTPKLQDAFRC